MTVDIDATDTVRGIFSIKQTISVAKTGRYVILYPKWVPGGHTPRNEIEKMAGLNVTASGKRRWRGRATRSMSTRST